MLLLSLIFVNSDFRFSRPFCTSFCGMFSSKISLTDWNVISLVVGIIVLREFADFNGKSEFLTECEFENIWA